MKLKKRHIEVILIVYICFFSMIVIAKYLSERDTESMYRANAFYFNSNMLNEEDEVKNFNVQKGKNEISFELQNYEDKLRISAVDINYTVNLLNKNGEIVDSKSGIFNKNNKTNQTITFDNLSPGVYTVNAISTKPYYQILTANYTVPELNENIEFDVVDTKGSQLVQLTVTSTDYKGKIKIIFPDTLIVDNTDDYFKDYDKSTHENSYEIDFVNDSEYTFKFFKTNSSDLYKKEDFSVTKK